MIEEHRGKKLICDINSLLENDGFQNITNKYPIHFIEKFGIGWDTIYLYSNRYIKRESNFIYQLLLSVVGYRIDIEGIIYHKFRYDKFHLTNIDSKTILEELNKIIKTIKQKYNNQIYGIY